MTEYDVWLAGIEQLGKESLYVLWQASGRKKDFAETLYRMKESELQRFCETAYTKENNERERLERRPLSLSQVNKIVRRVTEEKEIYSSREDLRELGRRLERKGIRYIWAGDSCFPKRLQYIDNPPFGLFVKGRLPDEDRPAVGIVGTRLASAYGRDQAKRFASELAAEGVQIISGMARGVDGVAGRGALDESDNSFAVLGGGVDICYPRENADLYEALAERGGLISEYRPGLQPQSRFFPARNRIISGLADLVLVVEAREQSGTLITVDRALEQGKDVWAIPGRICDRNSSGCNHLIRQGAGIALSPELLLEALGVKEAGEEAREIRRPVQMSFDFETMSLGDDKAERTWEKEPERVTKSTTEKITGRITERAAGRTTEEATERTAGRTTEETTERTAGKALAKSLEKSVAVGILKELDAATPRGLDDIAEEINRFMEREVPYSELMRELTRLILKGKVQEIRVGQYISCKSV